MVVSLQTAKNIFDQYVLPSLINEHFPEQVKKDDEVVFYRGHNMKSTTS